MRHARKDYDAIQAWPTRRPHYAKTSPYEATQLDVDEASCPIIPDDEPVFVLRARDAVGAAAVRMWVDLAHEAGTDEEVLRCVEAWADYMELWAEANGGTRVADVDGDHQRLRTPGEFGNVTGGEPR